MNSSHAVVLLRAQALESIVGALVGEFSGIGTKIEVQYWRFENSCGKEVAVGAVEPGRTNRKGGFLFLPPRQAHNLNEYKFKKASEA